MHGGGVFDRIISVTGKNVKHGGIKSTRQRTKQTSDAFQMNATRRGDPARMMNYSGHPQGPCTSKW